MNDFCIITKKKFDNTFKYYQDPSFDGFKYYFKPVGTVHITHVAELIINKNNFNVSLIAALCRCAHELNNPPPLIDSVLLNSLDTLKDIPKTFKEKYDHFLLMLYRTGGNEYKFRTIKVEDDYPLAFASDITEFQRIIDLAILSEDLECSNKIETDQSGTIYYSDLRFTMKGLKKIDKLINNYFSIVQPKIDSGNADTDRKINHAVSLFYQENATIEDKRSACEGLAFILEPFRKDLDKYFVDKDVNMFFQLVNEFDIRHNKEKTKKLIYEEQVEWIFQCLLNTLVTYIKIRKRFD